MYHGKMNKLYEHLNYFMNYLDMSINIEYDEEDQKIILSNKIWRKSLCIYRKEPNEIMIDNQSFLIEKEMKINDIVLWLYEKIIQYDQKSKIYEFMINIHKKYERKRKVELNEERQIIEIENIQLKIDEKGDIYSEENEDDYPISNISYDINETIEWIELSLLSEVSLFE
jgi:hypothetical protein